MMYAFPGGRKGFAGRGVKKAGKNGGIFEKWWNEQKFTNQTSW
jgi:hypothetical protein